MGWLGKEQPYKIFGKTIAGVPEIGPKTKVLGQRNN